MESPIDYLELPIPAESTSSPPGSPEKIATMRARASRGEAVFHPMDARPSRGEHCGGDVRYRAFVSAEDYDREHMEREQRKNQWRKSQRAMAATAS
jgi:hypothetical protein